MPDLHNTANPEIQNPFKPDEKIRLSELMGLVDEENEAFVAADAASEHGTDPTPELQAQYSTREITENNAQRAYVTGVGWCWMCDGEIIEVISQEGLDI